MYKVKETVSIIYFILIYKNKKSPEQFTNQK